MSVSNHTLLDLSDVRKMEQARVALVATEWNAAIVSEQIQGARRVADDAGAIVTHEIFVPGCFELPFACKAIWENVKSLSEAPEAIIAFGAVIRGGTPHFEYVCKAATEGILQLNISLPVPVIFGVLTLDSEAQAWERLGGPHGHKGEEAMISALKMIRMQRYL